MGQKTYNILSHGIPEIVVPSDEVAKMLIRRKLLRLMALTIAAIVMAGCFSNSMLEQTATVTSTPEPVKASATLSPSETATRQPTETMMPTETVTATEAPTGTATSTVEATKPSSELVVGMPDTVDKIQKLPGWEASGGVVGYEKILNEQILPMMEKLNLTVDQAATLVPGSKTAMALFTPYENFSFR